MNHSIVSLRRKISLSFLAALRAMGGRRSLLRTLTKEHSISAYFEAVRKEELTSEEAAELLQIRQESDCCIMRLLDHIWVSI